MRLIGHINEETRARAFSDYLYIQGIENQVEAEGDDEWALWVRDEDQLERAGQLLAQFRENPDHPDYREAREQAKARRAEEEKQRRAAEKRYYTRDRLFPQTALGIRAVTGVLMGISVVLSLIYMIPEARNLLQPFYIVTVRMLEGGSQVEYIRDLREILHGQVWRLITPIFIHFSILHLVFDMYWLAVFGNMIEGRQGGKRLLALVLITGVASNLGQYFVSGPVFGGMSGVVFGLFGYIWLRGKFDPTSGLFLDEWLINLLLIFFVIAMFIPYIAGMAHAVGLGLGCLIGYLTAIAPKHRIGR